MKKASKVNIYHTFEEYENSYYPNQSKKIIMKEDDPFQLGAILARESLKKVEHILSKKKSK